MGAALPDDDPLDRGTAHWAGFALTTVNSEMVLEVPAAVDPVYAGAIPPDTFFQHRLD